MGRGVNEQNARFIAEEMEDMRILFGSATINPNIKPGDKQKVAGSFAPIMKRLIENIANAMSKDGAGEFRREARRVMRDSLSFDANAREVEDILSGRDEESF